MTYWRTFVGILLAGTVVLAGCGDGVATADELSEWSEIARYRGFGNILLAGGVTDGRLYTVGTTHIDVLGDDWAGGPHGAVLGIADRPSAGHTLFAYRQPLERADLYVGTLAEPGNNLARVTLRADAYDLELSSPEWGKDWWNRSGGFNVSEQYLAAVVGEHPATRLPSLVPVLISFEINEDGSLLGSSDVRVLGPGLESVDLVAITTARDAFFVSVWATGWGEHVGRTGTYRVADDGALTWVTDRKITAVTEHRDALLAIDTDFELLQSTDGGSSWDVIGATNAWNIQFAHVGDELVVYGRFLLAHLDFGPAALSVRNLDKELFTRDAITSVTELDGMVYVTTTGGLFARPVEDFLAAEGPDRLEP